MTTFSVGPTAPSIFIPAAITLFLVAIGVLVATGNLPLRGIGEIRSIKNLRRVRLGILGTLIGISLVVWVLSWPATNTISVTPGEVSLHAWPYINVNIPVTDVKGAYVTQLGGGNFSLGFRTLGTSLGDYNVGLFQDSQGHSCYVISQGPHDLIVELNDGRCLVLGPSNLQALVSQFSADIRQVS